MFKKTVGVSLPVACFLIFSIIGSTANAQAIPAPSVIFENQEYKLKLNRTDSLNDPSFLSIIKRQPWFNGAQSFNELFGGDQPELIYRIMDKFVTDSMPITDSYPGLFPGFLVAIYPSGVSQTAVRVYQQTDFGYLGPGVDGIPNTDDDVYGPISIVNFTFDNTPYYFFSVVPSAFDTHASFRLNAFALRHALNLQSAKIAQGLGYDCTVYDQKNMCVSFLGSKSAGKGVDATAGALIVAHKPTKNFRFGGYIDQSFGSSTSGGLKLNKGSPGYGIFGVWSQNVDGSGVQVRAAANVGRVDIETTRDVIGSAEAGFGKSSIKSQGFSLEVSKDYAINSTWSARPYMGYRKTTNTRAGYTETDDVTTPLTYGSLKQNTETLTAGATFAHTLSAKTTIFLTAGVEHDFKNNVSRYAATSPDIDAIDSIDMSASKTKTRPAVSFALSHDIDKTQRIGVSLTHRKEAFASGSTTSAFLQYSRGF